MVWCAFVKALLLPLGPTFGNALHRDVSRKVQAGLPGALCKIAKLFDRLLAHVLELADVVVDTGQLDLAWAYRCALYVQEQQSTALCIMHCVSCTG